MEQNNNLRSREDIPEQYKWRLEDIYETEEAWLYDYARVNKMVEEVKKYKGNLSKSPVDLLNSLKMKDKILEITFKLCMYATDRKLENCKNTDNQSLYQKAEKFKSNIEAEVSFIEVEIINIPKETLLKFKNDIQELALYDFYFEKLARQKQHYLCEVEENILKKMSFLENSSGNIHDKLINADKPREYSIEDENGNVTSIKSSEYAKINEGKDRKLRLELYKAQNKYFRERKYLLGETYASVVNKDVALANIRNYNSCIEHALFNENISVDVYNNLISTVRSNLNLIHNFIGIYKKRAGLEDFHAYDFDVSLINTPSMEIPYLDATKMIKDCLSVLGEDYVSNLDKAFNSRWVDVYKNDGKQQNACTWSTYGCHPYVLVNYKNDISSLITLTHEMGHAMHRWYSVNEQPYAYWYSIPFVGEIASQVNEVLLLEHMIKNEKDKNTKIYLILKYLKQFYRVIILQTKFAEFEKIAHERCEKGEGINADTLSNIFHNLNVDYYGSEMVIDEEEDMVWSRIPHIFKTPFYVYSYATGFSAAIAIATRINQGDKQFINSYLDFLKKGGSDYPINVIKTLGIDLSTSEPIQLAFDKFKELLESLDYLLNNE